MLKVPFSKWSLLFVSPSLPYPLDDGLKVRAFYTLKSLSETHNVTLICFVKDGDAKNIRDLKLELNIRIIPVEFKEIKHNSFSHIYYTLFSRYPFYMKYSYTGEFREELESAIINQSFDVLYFYDRSMVLYDSCAPGLPKLLDSVDSQSLNSLSGFKSSKSIIYRIYWSVSYFKSKKLETSIYKNYDHVITAAERDADQLRALTDLDINSIPNGVDLSYFKPLGLEKIPNSLIFIGTMDAFSNEQAVLYFVEEIFPPIKERFPDVKLFVVGRNPPETILKLHDNENIFVKGYVEDLKSIMDRCEVVVSPLKMASGIQNKILAAMAMNKPIVSTEESIGEIRRYINDEDVVVAKNSEEFAQKVIDLFSDGDLLNRVGKNGRCIVKKNYTWESLGYKVDMLIENILN